jgi:ribosomal protein S17E
MSKVRQYFIKKISRDIYNTNPELITRDFESNKELVNRYGVEDKSLRNRVAGYLVIMKNKEGRIIQAPKKMKKLTRKDRRKMKKRRKK